MAVLDDHESFQADSCCYCLGTFNVHIVTSCTPLSRVRIRIDPYGLVISVTIFIAGCCFASLVVAAIPTLLVFIFVRN